MEKTRVEVATSTHCTTSATAFVASSTVVSTAPSTSAPSIKVTASILACPSFVDQNEAKERTPTVESKLAFLKSFIDKWVQDIRVMPDACNTYVSHFKKDIPEGLKPTGWVDGSVKQSMLCNNMDAEVVDKGKEIDGLQSQIATMNFEDQIQAWNLKTWGYQLANIPQHHDLPILWDIVHIKR
eukprot:Gb_19358 [translate_table: standard]